MMVMMIAMTPSLNASKRLLFTAVHPPPQFRDAIASKIDSTVRGRALMNKATAQERNSSLLPCVILREIGNGPDDVNTPSDTRVSASVDSRLWLALP